jgi:hypothetical protein
MIPLAPPDKRIASNIYCLGVDKILKVIYILVVSLATIISSRSRPSSFDCPCRELDYSLGGCTGPRAGDILYSSSQILHACLMVTAAHSSFPCSSMYRARFYGLRRRADAYIGDPSAIV